MQGWMQEGLTDGFTTPVFATTSFFAHLHPKGVKYEQQMRNLVDIIFMAPLL